MGIGVFGCIKMDISEFDPLHDKSNESNTDLLSNIEISLTDEASSENGSSAHNTSLDQTSSMPDRKRSDPTGLSTVVPTTQSVPNVPRRDGLKPARPPPPPPPMKGRSASDNTLLDQDQQTSSLPRKEQQLQRTNQGMSSFYTHTTPLTASETNLARSGQGKSSFYTNSGTMHPASETNLTRSDRGGSAFYLDSSHSDSDSNLTRSSFYFDEKSAPVTRQPRSGSLQRPHNMSVAEGDFSDLRGQREQMMQMYMATREQEYTVRQPFKVFAGTWNVNGQTPPNDVNDWLSTKDLNQNTPDLYFLGFQELDLSKEAMVFTESSREDEWLRVVERSFPDSSKYVLIKCQRLVGMMLLVYVKSIHRLSVNNISYHQVGTGLLGRMGNKGGVAVRFDLHRSSICVVNSHLAAHLEQCGRRNEDYHSICSKLRFALDDQQPLSLFKHDIVFWLGDLNYRIQSLESEDVKQKIDDAHYKYLREYDQLMMQKSSGHVFRDFDEGPLDFRPTYKYNPGTDDWDTSEKCRTPAWCDRVLWWEPNKNRGESTRAAFLKEYQQHMALKISDHKPVSAQFDVKVKVIDNAKYQKVFEEENRRLDKMENENLPTMTLSAQQIEFGPVRFQEARLQTLEIANTGLIPCKFEFICPPSGNEICRKWLTITSPKGCLFPGENCVLEFEVYVNRITAPLLNSGQERLDDILILHLVGGKDFFITVSGRYVPSCFGMSIEALCRLPDPVATVSPEKMRELSAIPPERSNGLLKVSKTLPVPKELWRLIDHLYRNAKYERDLFQQPGLHAEIEEIRDQLDTTLRKSYEAHDGTCTLPGSNHSAAEALLILLEAMPEPVIAYHLYEACLMVSDHFHTCKEVLLRLSPQHRGVFKYIMSFLRELLKYSEDNGLNADLLANVFSGLLLRPPYKKSLMEMKIDRERSKKFISHFLHNAYDQ